MKKSYLLFAAALCAASSSLAVVKENDIIDLTSTVKGIVVSVKGTTAKLEIYANPDNKPAGELTIPYSYDLSDGYTYVPVRIQSEGFRACDELTAVTVGADIEFVGAYAFTRCTKLASFTETVPGSVKSVGADAFSWTSALEKISLPGVYTIGEWAFRYSSLQSAAFPDVEYIMAGAFQECQGLKEFTGGEKLKEIGNVAFCNAPEFSSITLGPDLTKIGGMAFAFCQGLKEIVIPENVKEIGKDAFQGLALERAFILSPDFMSFCEDSKILRDMDLKEVYCADALTAEISEFIETNAADYPLFYSKDVQVKPLSDVVDLVPSYEKDYFTAVDKIDGVSFITVFDPETGKDIPNIGPGYHIPDDKAGLRYWVNKKNLLRYVTAVSRPSGIENIDAIDNIDGSEHLEDTLYYDLQGREVKNPSKGLYIVAGKKVIL